MSSPLLRRLDRQIVVDRVVERASTAQFRRLPPEVQAEYRERWQEELARQVAREEGRGARRVSSTISGVVLFTVVLVIWGSPGLVTLPAAILIGGAVGLAWELLHVGRFVALALAMGGYVVLCTLGAATDPFQLFFGAVAMASFSAVLGVMREVGDGNLAPGRLDLRRLLPRRIRDRARRD